MNNEALIEAYVDGNLDAESSTQVLELVKEDRQLRDYMLLYEMDRRWRADSDSDSGQRKSRESQSEYSQFSLIDLFTEGELDGDEAEFVECKIQSDPEWRAIHRRIIEFKSPSMSLKPRFNTAKWALVAVVVVGVGFASWLIIEMNRRGTLYQERIAVLVDEADGLETKNASLRRMAAPLQVRKFVEEQINLPTEEQTIDVGILDYLTTRARVGVIGNIAFGLADLNKNEEAKSWLKKIESKDRVESAQYWSALGKILLVDKDETQAISCFEKSLDLHYSMPDRNVVKLSKMAMHIADLYVAQNDNKGVIKTFDLLSKKVGVELKTLPQVVSIVTYAKAKQKRLENDFVGSQDLLTRNKHFFEVAGEVDLDIRARFDFSMTATLDGLGEADRALEHHRMFMAVFDSQNEEQRMAYTMHVYDNITLMAVNSLNSKNDFKESRKLLDACARDLRQANKIYFTRLSFTSLLNHLQLRNDAGAKSQLASILETYYTSREWPEDELRLYAWAFLIAGDTVVEKDKKKFWDVAIPLIEEHGFSFPEFQNNVGNCLVQYASLLDSDREPERIVRLKSQGESLINEESSKQWDLAAIVRSLKVEQPN
jgi:tetratricopeptide (TPR) repeat protein